MNTVNHQNAGWVEPGSTQPAFSVFSGLVMLLAFTLLSAPAGAAVYQDPAKFIAETFSGAPPASSILWLKKELKKEIRNIMGHRWGGLRLRYWQKGPRSVWIMDEVGKERPITVGIVINRNRIERVKVLEFRESRGWEIRYPSFTKQFIGARITDNNTLNQTIDGISGATLSVRALQKLARLALFLSQRINNVPH